MADPLFDVNNDTVMPTPPQTSPRGLSMPEMNISVPRSVGSSSDGYRESIGSEDILRTREMPTVSTPQTPASPTFTPQSQEAVQLPDASVTFSTTTEGAGVPVLQTQPLTTADTIPDNSVAAELRKHQNRSPIERGAAPHLQAIQAALEREKQLVRPEETVKKTIPGDPLFAPNLIKSQEKSAEQIAAEVARAEEAKQRGFEKAEEAGKKQPIKSLRTFQLDIAEAMRGQHSSTIQSALSEHHAKEEKEIENTYQKKRSVSFLVSAIMLIIIGLGALGVGGWYWYTTTLDKDSQQKTDILVPSFFSTETKKEISADNLNGAGLRSAIKHTLTGTDLFVDSISQIYITEITPATTKETAPIKTVLSTQQFLSLIGSTIPQWLMRTLDPTYMLGVHVWNGNHSFLVFSTSGELFDNTFSGMLKWEPTMAQDLLPLFGVPVTQDVYTRTWGDVILKNRDVRAIKDNDGNIVLLYTFYDRKTLIITTSPDTMDEIIQRIIQTKRQ
ncbi:MAG: hypothetical protein HGA67_01405 [Candidatus Yonathbacteria bacterium]|nr:hypothetical protein [Candidatus Yonathbacteria bacterium]